MNCAENLDKWNRIDDVIYSLLNRIIMPSNGRLSSILYYFIGKFVAITMRNRNDIAHLTDIDHIEKQLKTSVDQNMLEAAVNLESVRDVSFDNLAAYRWIKKLLLCISQCDFYGNRFDVLFKLHVIAVTIC